MTKFSDKKYILELNAKTLWKRCNFLAKICKQKNTFEAKKTILKTLFALVFY
jgi:hypothetical protein